MGVFLGSTGRHRWLPVQVAFAIALVSTSIWYQWPSHHQRRLEERIKLQAERIDVDLNRRTAPLVGALRHLADSGRTNGTGMSNDVQALSARTLERFTSLSAIALVDSEYGLRWIQSKSKAALSLDDVQVAERACDRLLGRALAGSWGVVDRSDLAVAGAGFVLGLPVTDKGHTKAFIVALFHYEDFFSEMIGERHATYGLQVLAGSRELYRRGNWRPDVSVTAAAALHFPGADWQVRLWQPPVGQVASVGTGPIRE